MRIVVDCHGHHLISNMLLLQLVGLLSCYGLHFVESVCIGDKCTAPCSEEEFSWWKNLWYYFYSISYELFEFLFENKVKCKSNKFHWCSIDWIKCNMKLFMFHDKADGQTHVHCHCIVFVVLSILSIQSPPLQYPEQSRGKWSRNERPMHMMILPPCTWTWSLIGKGRCMHP